MDLAINPNTIQRAYAQLEMEGYVYSVAGRGTCWRRDRSRIWSAAGRWRTRCVLCCRSCGSWA